MNLYQRMAYRWKNCQDALPGELEPVIIDGLVTYVVWSSQPEEVETNEWLRHWRGLLGYGPAWTFRSALWDWFMPKFLVGAVIFMVIVYFYLRTI